MRTSGSYDQRHFIGKANERTKITDVPAEATQTERANAIILSSYIFGYKICAYQTDTITTGKCGV